MNFVCHAMSDILVLSKCSTKNSDAQYYVNFCVE